MRQHPALKTLSSTLTCLLLASACAAVPHIDHAGQQVISDAEASERSKSLLLIREELRKAEVIPTVLDDFTPVMTLKIAWPWHDTSNYNLTSKLGNTLDPDLLQRTPNVYLTTHSSGDIDDVHEQTESKDPEYVLTMTDPDAPSRKNPKWSEMCHWIVSTHGTEHNVEEVVKYKAPGPPPKTGLHRYVFTAWVAANGTSAELHLEKPADRKRWGYGKDERDAGRVGVQKWACDNGLRPVAANFVYAQNEKQ